MSLMNDDVIFKQLRGPRVFLELVEYASVPVCTPVSGSWARNIYSHLTAVNVKSIKSSQNEVTLQCTMAVRHPPPLGRLSAGIVCVILVF